MPWLLDGCWGRSLVFFGSLGKTTVSFSLYVYLLKPKISDVSLRFNQINFEYYVNSFKSLVQKSDWP